MLSQDEARARVARGAAHLDTVRPGWFNRIDVGTLTLDSHCNCVLAQCYSASYGHAARIAGVDVDLMFMKPNSAPVLGFHYEGDDLDGIPLLQNAWIELIADRKLAAEQSWVKAVQIMATAEPVSLVV